MLDRKEIAAAIRETGVVLVVRGKRPELLLSGVEAVLKAGVRCIEVTFTVAGAAEVIAQVRDRFGDEVVLGAGTVTRPGQVDAAVKAGARYIVSPGFDPKVLNRSKELGALACPGVYTPTEVTAAVNAGADMLKLFPAGAAGVSHFKALQGPFPGLEWIPTGGIGAENLAEWFAAGAAAVGAGSKLFPPALVEAEKWDELTAVAEKFMEAVKLARSK